MPNASDDQSQLAATDSTAPFRRRVPDWLRTPTSDSRYLLYCRVFAVASAARLTLPDAMQPGWLAPVSLHWFGAMLLAINGNLSGWCFAVAGTAWPLLFLHDQLSQSVYLCLCAISALAMWVGSSNGRSKRLSHGLPAAIRWLTLLVYTFAAVHKLNRGYFNPDISCANEGLRVLGEYSSTEFPRWLRQSFDSSFWAPLHLSVEFAIPALLLWRPTLGVLLAALMHVPLTIIFAPSFAFTMLSGWVCFFRAAELQRFLEIAWQRKVAIVGVSLLLAGLSRLFLFEARWSEDPEWCVKEALFLLVFVAAWNALPTASALSSRGAWGEPKPAMGRVLALCSLFACNALTPYMGLQYHHTAAMLSNLRIDEGCHNSLLFPEALRGPDPYVRLDRIGFDPQKSTPGAEAAFVARLWEPSALHAARAKWCAIQRRPLPVGGSYRGRTFLIDNFCADDGWPLPEPALPGFRRFQVNLTRQCERRCLH